MPSYSVSASEIKYASGSSWTSGKARQGVYSSTRYEGALNFAGLANFSFSNIAVTGIQMRVTFGPTGGSSTKYLTLYGGAKNSISGSIASMRGSALGAVTVSNAFDRTVALNFNSGSEAAIYNALVNFFTSGNRVLILYVPKTRGTYSGGYCYDYLSVTAMALTFTYEYLQSSGSMASNSVAAGSAAKLNITACNSAYSHRVTWKFGTYSNVQTIAAGGTSASYTIPLNWLKAIPNAASGTASATLETLDTSGNTLGTSSYNFTVTVPAGVTPNLESVTVAPANSNSVLAGWNAYAYGKSQAKITINVVVLSNGSKAGSLKVEHQLGDRLLKKGMSGSDVRELQQNLLKLGYALPKYGADGDYGAETVDAVKTFQKKSGLETDGIYGSNTHKSLTAALEASKEPKPVLTTV